MTTVMRSNFERYNCVVFLDSMKRKTYIHLWPYMSIVIVNNLGESRPAYKSVLVLEINESYVFLIQSALKMASNVNPCDIWVVFGNQFFTKELLQTF